MKLHKIYQIRIPTMYNTPCQVAVFTDGKRVKYSRRIFRIGGEITVWSDMAPLLLSKENFTKSKRKPTAEKHSGNRECRQNIEIKLNL